jgi:hypothetical protein
MEGDITWCLDRSVSGDLSPTILADRPRHYTKEPMHTPFHLRLASSIAAPIAIAAAALAAIAPAASGATVFSTGFEPATFAPGNVIGQDGWQPIPNATGPAEIQTATVKSGDQAVRTSGTGTSSYVTHPLYSPVAEQIATIEVVYLQTGSPLQASIGVYGGENGSQFIAQLGHCGNGFFLGNTNSAVDLAGFTNNAWHHLVLTLDFDAHTMTGHADGNLVGTIPINNAVYPTFLSYVAVGTYGSGTTGTDSYFDNVSVSSLSTSTPEPATLAASSLATLLLRRRR